MTLQEAIWAIRSVANEYVIVVRMWTADDVADEIRQREEVRSMSRKGHWTVIADAMSTRYFRSLKYCVDSDWMLLSEAVTEALEACELG